MINAVDGNVKDGRAVLDARGFTCIFPVGVNVEYTSFPSNLLANGMTPAITYNQTIHFNKNIYALRTLEMMVHETVHVFQERRMGKLSYWPTYFWQIFISMFKKGPNHIHDDHLMEREARRIARLIVSTAVPNSVIDIEAEIKKVTGW